MRVLHRPEVLEDTTTKGESLSSPGRFKIPIRKVREEERPTNIPTTEPYGNGHDSDEGATYGEPLFPEEFIKECPISCSIYSTFERWLPGNGHAALLLAINLASIFAPTRRQVNGLLGASAGEGKTEIMEKFVRLPFVNFLDQTTYADYLINFCSQYYDDTIPPPKDLPKGWRFERVAGVTKAIKTANVVDKVHLHTDIYHAGENITTIGGMEKLLALWMGLIEKGHWDGGNRYVGRYKIGDPVSPIRHGILLACTLDDMRHSWVKQAGFLSRCVPMVLAKNRYEHDYIDRGLIPPNIRLVYPDFSGEISGFMRRITPSTAKPVWSPELENNPLLFEILQLITVGRGDLVPERAANDRLALLISHAYLNGRYVVKLVDLYMVLALLQMCRKVMVSSGTRSGQTPYYMGNRLIFQMKLRDEYYQKNEDELIKKQIGQVFLNWDGRSCVYPDEYIDFAIKAVRSPISDGVP